MPPTSENSPASEAKAQPSEARRERSFCLLILLTSASVFAALAWPMWHGQVYLLDDLGNFHLPLRKFYAECLAHGDSFLWSPDLYCGFYVHGEGQAGMCHPLHWALYRWLPLGVAFNLEMLLNYPVLMGGMYVWFRRWKLPRDAALFGSMVFTFSGFNLLHAVHVNALSIVAQIPWLLVAVDVLARGESSRARAWAAVAVALLVASQTLLGYPQYLWFSVLVLGLYLIFLAFQRKWRFSGLTWLAAGGLIGLLMGAVQLLPTWDAMRNSERAETTLTFRAERSLHPLNLLQVANPYLFKGRAYGLKWPAEAMEYGVYNGAVATTLMLWLLVRWRQLGRLRPLAIGAWTLAGAGVLLSLGGYTPLFHLYGRIPLVSMFRAPCRHILLVHLAMAIGAAVAYSDLARSARQEMPQDRGRIAWMWLLPLAGLALLALNWWPDLSTSAGLGSKLAPWPAAALGAAIVFLATSLVVAAAKGSRSAFAALVVFAALDTAIYGLTFLHMDRPHDSMPVNEYLARVPRPPPGKVGSNADRIWSLGHGNELAAAGLKMANGYVALKPDRHLDYRQDICLRLAGVRWVLNPENRTPWRELDDPLPYARLVTKARQNVLPNRDAGAIDWVNEALADRPLALSGSAPGQVEAVRRPGSIRFRCQATGTQLLVVAESFHEGWRASAAGSARPVVRTNGDFLGVVLEEGDREVWLRFEPMSYRVGRAATGLGIGLLFVMILTAVLRGWVPAKSIPAQTT